LTQKQYLWQQCSVPPALICRFDALWKSILFLIFWIFLTFLSHMNIKGYNNNGGNNVNPKNTWFGTGTSINYSGVVRLDLSILRFQIVSFTDSDYPFDIFKLFLNLFTMRNCRFVNSITSIISCRWTKWNLYLMELLEIFGSISLV
jgi:hypothetical protein